MALSARERKQKQLEREREQLRSQEDSTYEFLRKPFYDRLETDLNWSSVMLPFELMGLEPPVFEDDRGPEHFVDERVVGDPADIFRGFRGSIGRAEAMVDCLSDAAIELASIINDYKRAELAARRKEIEAADLSDPNDRKAALESVAKIAAIEAELARSVRRTLPQWKVKGV